MKTITLLAGMVALLVIQDSKPASAPAASPKDVATEDAILGALYDVISGPAGQERDWNRFRSLFMPKAQLIAVVPLPGGGVRPIVMTPDDYAQRAGPKLRESGFFEREIAQADPRVRGHRPGVQHLRVAARRGRREAVRSRHQQHPAHEGQEPLVGRLGLLGGGDGRDPAPGGVPAEVTSGYQR